MKRAAAAISCALILSAGPAMSGTLVWDSNREPDLAGYRVYACPQLPCGKGEPGTMLVAVLGKTTSLDVGTPAVIQHYFVTAYDSAGNESVASNVASNYPATASPPPSPPALSPSPPAGAVPPPAPSGLRITGVR